MPEDIEIATLERLVDLITGQEKDGRYCGLCCPDKVEKQNLYSWDANKRKSGTYQ